MIALIVFGSIVLGVVVFAAGMVVGRSTRETWPTKPKLSHKSEDDF